MINLNESETFYNENLNRYRSGFSRPCSIKTLIANANVRNPEYNRVMYNLFMFRKVVYSCKLVCHYKDIKYIFKIKIIFKTSQLYILTNLFQSKHARSADSLSVFKNAIM